MKKQMIITALIVFLIAAKVAVPNALAQEEQATKYKLVPLPPQSKPGSSGIAFNLGVLLQTSPGGDGA